MHGAEEAEQRSQVGRRGVVLRDNYVPLSAIDRNQMLSLLVQILFSGAEFGTDGVVGVRAGFLELEVVGAA